MAKSQKRGSNTHTRRKSGKDRRSLSRLPVERFCWELLRVFIDSVMPLASDDCKVVLGSYTRVIRQRDWETYESYSDSLSLQSIGSGFCGTNATDVAILRQVSQLLKKFDDGSDDSIARKRASAIEKFTAAEEACRQTNRRMRSKSIKPFTKKVLEIASHLIYDLLGPSCPIDEMIYYAGHGKGSTASLSYSQRDHYYKWSEQEYQTATGARGLLAASVIDDDRWIRGLMSRFSNKGNNLLSLIVPNDTAVIGFVPKDRSTFRTIAKEPTYSMYLQRGMHAVLAKRLRKVGIDISDQSYNQKLAKLGSVNGNLCTVDFSSASDTVSTSLVQELFPVDWWSILLRIRSRFYTLDGRRGSFEKLSSMGNGFTFCVETLIFWALAKAVTSLTGGHAPHAYGDDVIIDVKAFALYRSVVIDLGFSLNDEKSFTSGSCRESCGEDYFGGINIRPFYFRAVPTSKPELYALLNGLSLWWQRTFSSNEYSLQPFYLWLMQYHGGEEEEVFFGPPDVDVTYEYLWDATFPIATLGSVLLKTWSWRQESLGDPVYGWLNVLRASLRPVALAREFIKRDGLPRGGHYVKSKRVVWYHPDLHPWS